MELDNLSDDELYSLESRLEEEKKRREDAGKYNPVGMWNVTTEGDEEGRTVRGLGVHEGHLGDIMFALAPATFYSLTPRRMTPKVVAAHDGSEDRGVNMCYSNLFGYIEPKIAVPMVQRLLGPKFKVSRGQYYCSVKIEKA